MKAIEAARASQPAAAPGNAAASDTAESPLTWEDGHTTLPGSLAAGLRRLTQWVHTSDWRHWTGRRLTPTQWKVLALLSARPQGLSLTAVARELGPTAATICDCIKALRKKGFVTQYRSSRDGREQTLRLTRPEQAIARELLTEDPLREVFVGLTAAEQQCFQVLWMKMIHALCFGLAAILALKCKPLVPCN